MTWITDDRMSDSTAIQWFYAETTYAEATEDVEDAWSWLQPKPKLPRTYPPQLLMNTNQCHFSIPMRYQKIFQGHRFKLGGHKE